jgi:lysophospholipase L1-like esterase
MNLARLSIAVLVVGVLLAAYSFLRKEAPIETHRYTRQVILHYTFSRAERPIIVLGDSITEASTLPRSVCDRALVNAGLDGASTVSDLGNWLNDVLDGRRATTILVALGTNDALQGRDQKEFETNYASLLAKLKGSADHLVVLGIPSIEVRGRMPADYQAATMRRIDAFNAALPTLAEKAGAAFAPLPPMGAPHTIDGIHLDAAGYAVWDAAILKAVSSACSTSAR